MIKVKNETENNKFDSKWAVKIKFPYYESDEEINNTIITVRAPDMESAKYLANKYINNKKHSQNKKIWLNAYIDDIREV